MERSEIRDRTSGIVNSARMDSAALID